MNSLYKNHVLAKQNTCNSSRQSHRVTTSNQHMHFLTVCYILKVLYARNVL